MRELVRVRIVAGEYRNFFSSFDQYIPEFNVATVAHSLANHRLNDLAPSYEGVPGVWTEVAITALTIFGTNGAG